MATIRILSGFKTLKAFLYSQKTKRKDPLSPKRLVRGLLWSKHPSKSSVAKIHFRDLASFKRYMARRTFTGFLGNILATIHFRDIVWLQKLLHEFAYLKDFYVPSIGIVLVLVCSPNPLFEVRRSFKCSSASKLTFQGALYRGLLNILKLLHIFRSFWRSYTYNTF